MNELKTPVDLASPELIVPGMLLLVIALAAAIAFLGEKHDRVKRSLALLIILIASFGIFFKLLPLALGSGLSVAIFFGLFFVFHLLGRFEPPR